MTTFFFFQRYVQQHQKIMLHCFGELDHPTTIFSYEQYFSGCMIYQNGFHFLRMRNNLNHVHAHLMGFERWFSLFIWPRNFSDTYVNLLFLFWNTLWFEAKCIFFYNRNIPDIYNILFLGNISYGALFIDPDRENFVEPLFDETYREEFGEPLSMPGEKC